MKVKGYERLIWPMWLRNRYHSGQIVESVDVVALQPWHDALRFSRVILLKPMEQFANRLTIDVSRIVSRVELTSCSITTLSSRCEFPFCGNVE